MKLVFKVVLLVMIVIALLNNIFAIASENNRKITLQIPSNVTFKNKEQKLAYALGVSLGLYIDNALKEQKKLGIILDKKQIIIGFEDAFSNKRKLSDTEITQTLKFLQDRIKDATQQKIKNDLPKNLQEGNAYAKKFAKEKGVQKTKSGLLYQIKKEGKNNEVPKDNDTVVVNYIGSFPNGTEFDNTYIRGKPVSLRVDSIISGWAEGMKHLKKGGKIKLVIPPNLAYGKNGIHGIPGNSTLIFDVELLDIKPTLKINKQKTDK